MGNCFPRSGTPRALKAFLVIVPCLFIGLAEHALAEQTTLDDEPPRLKALLEQARAAETMTVAWGDADLAAALYRQAGEMGSADAYYRAAQLLMTSTDKSKQNLAQCMLALASQLGHEGAASRLDQLALDNTRSPAKCGDDLPAIVPFRFDMPGYLADLSQDKQRVAKMIRRLAPLYAVDVNLALAIATAESNFNAYAVSPKMAMGVMQLMPATAERFNVRDPYNPAQNIRGGLAYLRWLKQFFAGDTVRVIAAYNAGEGAVIRYDGAPPYRETREYITRVLSYAGYR